MRSEFLRWLVTEIAQAAATAHRESASASSAPTAAAAAAAAGAPRGGFARLWLLLPLCAALLPFLCASRALARPLLEALWLAALLSPPSLPSADAALRSGDGDDASSEAVGRRTPHRLLFAAAEPALRWVLAYVCPR